MMTSIRQTNSSRQLVANIPSSYSRLIARELNLNARQLHGLLTGTDLSIEQLLNEDSLFTANQQILILRNALALSEKPEFGLRLGRRLTPATHGAVGFAASNSPNLLSALKAIDTFLPTRASLIELYVNQVGDDLECILHFQTEMDENVRRCLADIIVKVLFEFGEFIVGRTLAEAEIFFPHSAPEYQDIYASYLPGKIHFECDHLKLKLPMTLCLEPNASANNENYRLAIQHCESMLSQVQTRSHSYQTRLKKMMLSLPPGALNEEEAAASLFMSKRTMARRLKEENSSFRAIREEILSQQAIAYLSNSKLSIETIAELMNYHDSANFRRAFKRWFNQPPEKFRQRIRINSNLTY